jgi:hypothetical protein
MRAPWLSLLLLLAGCDRVFALHRTELSDAFVDSVDRLPWSEPWATS